MFNPTGSLASFSPQTSYSVLYSTPMMLKSILFLATSAVGIVAQTVSVNTPRPGDTISASSPFTVEVQQAVRSCTVSIKSRFHILHSS